MKCAVFDTNIIIDWLNGYARAQELLFACEEPLISVITWMEVMVGVKAQAEQQETRNLLSAFPRVELEPTIIEEAVTIRRDIGLKLWDAIILATARVNGVTLVTRNTRDFKASNAVHIPYHL